MQLDTMTEQPLAVVIITAYDLRMLELLTSKHHIADTLFVSM